MKNSESVQHEYHFHLYFPLDRYEEAKKVLDGFKGEFSLPVGRQWDRPVGPHPIGSCQITVTSDFFETVVHWFFKHRGGFDVFVHHVSGDDLRDHTDAVMWIGKSHPLKLEMFRKSSD